MGLGALRVTVRTAVQLDRTPAAAPAAAAADAVAPAADAATSATPPSASEMRSDASQPSEISEIAGLGELVLQIREAIELPLRRRHLFEAAGLAAPTGLLLHGPPGTGKTLCARTICKQLGLHMVSLGSASLLASQLGEAEAALEAAFEETRAKAPAVLFLDEVDGGHFRVTAWGHFG